jgi:ribosomal peptide maturation radical SAM protein 1
VFHSFVLSHDWSNYQLAGISVCLNQLTSALLLAKMIKKYRRDIPIVFGGSSCAGEMGNSIISTFDEIDFVVEGEGEVQLLGLCRFLKGEREDAPEGVISKRHENSPRRSVQLKDLDELPCPDFDDFFHEVSMLPPSARFFPVIPAEFSRGCPWGKCNFCNLNLQWKGYRTKSSEKMIGEIEGLSLRHRIIDFAFVDNCLPEKNALNFFSHISATGHDYSFFAEIRTDYSLEEMDILSRGGLKEIQAGIEALSTSLLRRMRKGKSVMDNVAVMRHAEETGTKLSGNLIIHFPGSTEEEVEETLWAMDFIWPFSPLKTVSFWLGAGSPVEKAPEIFKIADVRPHHNNFYLFPEDIMKNLSPMILQYRGDRGLQKRLWRSVERKARDWRKERERLGMDKKLLTYRRGRDFLIIRQVMPGGRVNMHRMSGLSMKLYLKCLSPAGIDELVDFSKDRRRPEIEGFVNDLVQKRLMFKEGDKALALAIRC